MIWSGVEFPRRRSSSGAVAFAIVSLLPVELILQVGGSAGFAMVFALLVAAIIWNLGTWWFGLPASSSHTLIGSIIGVGIANQLMSVKTGTSGVDWGTGHQHRKVAAALSHRRLRASPPCCSSSARKRSSRTKNCTKRPKGTEPPPFWIRAC